jgi:Holliday junction resolvase-like predicted endonuclease
LIRRALLRQGTRALREIFGCRLGEVDQLPRRGQDPGEIVFTRSVTEAVNLTSARAR